MSAALQPSSGASARQSALSARAKRAYQAQSSRQCPGGRALTAVDLAHQGAQSRASCCRRTLFEQMGFTYLGPVDGHDLKSVCELLAQAKEMKKPVLLHVMTQKGRGYAPSENNPDEISRRIAVRPRDGRISLRRRRLGLLGAFRRGAVRVLRTRTRASVRSRRRCRRARV